MSNGCPGRRADFRPFAASVFIPHIFNGSVRCQMGCGATALALLTGVPPEDISAKNGRAHYADHFMLKFLRVRKFRTLRLTPAIIARAKSEIGAQHVILVSQLLRQAEASWGVIFEDSYYHNFDTYSLSALAFLNKPIMSAYLVIHRKWQVDYAHGEQKAKPRLKGHQLKLAALRKHCSFAQIRKWA
jgi:hypothetical protein